MPADTIPEYDLEDWLVCPLCGNDEVRYHYSKTEDRETTRFYKCSGCYAVLKIPPEE